MRSRRRLLLAAQISAVLNFSAAWVAFLGFALSKQARCARCARRAPATDHADGAFAPLPPRQAEELGYLQRFVESVCFTVGLNYGLGFLSELFILVSVAAASILCARKHALRSSTHCLCV